MVSAYPEHDGTSSAEEELADSKASSRHAGSREPLIEATLFDKFAVPDDLSGDLLSKRIALGPKRRPVSDASPCRMSRGRAHRLRLPLHRALPVFARLIDDAPGNRAFSLGAMAAHQALPQGPAYAPGRGRLRLAVPDQGRRRAAPLPARPHGRPGEPAHPRGPPRRGGAAGAGRDGVPGTRPTDTASDVPRPTPTSRKRAKTTRRSLALLLSSPKK
jgi:hypothetical protein